MCRLFGFRSVIQSQVHRSLVAADNALAVQSRKHADGWGVAYYVADSPHVIKSVEPAEDDQIFERVSGVVASQTVLAHLRKATQGEVNILNSHPFQYGVWTFAHNGDVFGFPRLKEEIRGMVAPALRRFILGDTDSETLFYLFLTYLSQLTDIHRRGATVEHISRALAEMVWRVTDLADGTGEEERSKLTFIATDGASMVATRRITPLLYSTFKSRCLDRGECPFLDACCEGPTDTGFVNHLILSSEELQGDNQWIELADGDVVGVDWRMSLYRGKIIGPGEVELVASYRQDEVRT